MTVYSGTNADGRKLLRIEARNAETPIERKPPWIKTRMRTGPEYQRIKDLVGNEGLHTVSVKTSPANTGLGRISALTAATLVPQLSARGRASTARLNRLRSGC